MQKRLERSTTDRVFTGVCGGLAQYLAVDATFVRVFFVVGSVLTAFLLTIVYFVLLFLMPMPGEPAPIEGLAVPGTISEGRRNLAAYVLIGLGLIFLLGNYGIFRPIPWQIIWPLVLIGIGAMLLLRRAR